MGTPRNLHVHGPPDRTKGAYVVHRRKWGLALLVVLVKAGLAWWWRRGRSLDGGSDDRQRNPRTQQVRRLERAGLRQAGRPVGGRGGYHLRRHGPAVPRTGRVEAVLDHVGRRLPRRAHRREPRRRRRPVRRGG